MSVWQLSRILYDRLIYQGYDQSTFEWMSALDALRCGDVSNEYKRYDLVCYVYGQKSRTGVPRLPRDTPREEYTGQRQLHAVEIYLHHIDGLVQEVHSKSIPLDENIPSQRIIIQRSPQVVELSRRLLQERAESFPPRFAKLYSQHKRLREGQRGLTGWQPHEAPERLNEAVQLLQTAFIARDVDESGNWRKGMQRAGEILEWLAHPELNVSQLPIRLLSAAVYQLAGYPARALGILQQTSTEDTESHILRALLKADFPVLLRLLTEYWARTASSEGPITKGSPWELDNFERWVINETMQALGILCAEMRWGSDPRIEQAQEKLTRVSKMMLHGQDVYSWLLSKLCAEVVSAYLQSSFRHHLPSITFDSNYFGKKAIESYLRLCYTKKKALAWPSQVRGIERLKSNASFALCTPTGSGKTTVAEVAILQSLLKQQILEDEALPIFDTIAPLVIYLTPSRALAAEVESTLSRALSNLGTGKIVVTGLYGGTDWGPTDAWLHREDRTVLICTYEKAEALMRFLGVWLRDRITLVIIDEAHMVNFDRIFHTLRRAENRTFRLESLGTRLLAYLDETKTRVIALSAVASGMGNALACWVSHQEGAEPERHFYRSTRQLIGRLECLPGGNFEIVYDLLDSADLQFETQRDGKPYIPRPFPPYPPTSSDWSGPQRKLRPYTLWAAMHLAQRNADGQQNAVLISITQGISGYAKSFLTLLDSDWDNVQLPNFFEPPLPGSDKDLLWQDCLKACEDYFTTASREYRLLQQGIIVHHGQMPGSLARLLVEAIQGRIVHLVLATSTLSEGVNLPFETVLIPNIARYEKQRGLEKLDDQELGNLIGRAGRPGFSTEGQSLVLMTAGASQQRDYYFDLVNALQAHRSTEKTSTAQSPLAQLLNYIVQQWSTISDSTNTDEFINWLETTTPLEWETGSENELSLIESLDTLDSFLLSTIVELEQIVQEDLTADELEALLHQLSTMDKSNSMPPKTLTADELEEQLRRIWQYSYARYASQEESYLEEFFVCRGRVLLSRIYPDSTQRRKLYRTSLPPRDGNGLLNLYPDVIEHLKTGTEYLVWNNSQCFEYVKKTVTMLDTLPKFKLHSPPSNSEWQNILRWWFDRPTPAKVWFGTVQPTVAQISSWHKYISQNFGYRFNWGLGSIIALAVEDAFGDLTPALDDWPQTGLPWAAFWMKELIIWGTLDPVAAYLLARRMEVTRSEAEQKAQEYYAQHNGEDPDEILNPTQIRDWAETLSSSDLIQRLPNPPTAIPIERLLYDFSETDQNTWKVVPVETENQIYWFDLAGFALAVSPKFERWLEEYLEAYDFTLNVSKNEVSCEPYI